MGDPGGLPPGQDIENLALDIPWLGQREHSSKSIPPFFSFSEQKLSAKNLVCLTFIQQSNHGKKSFSERAFCQPSFHLLKMINIMSEFRSARHAFSATGKGLDWMSVTGFILSLMGHSCPLLRPWTSAKKYTLRNCKNKIFYYFQLQGTSSENIC